MKLNLFIAFFLVVNSAWSLDGQEILRNYISNAAASSSVSVTVIDRLKNFGSDEFHSDTISVFIKRNAGSSQLIPLFRLQHSDGINESFDGRFYKRLDNLGKTYIVSDTSESAYGYVQGGIIPRLVQLLLPNDTISIEVDNRYKRFNYSIVTFDGKPTYQIGFRADIAPAKNPDGSYVHLPAIVRDSLSLTISADDYRLLNFYRQFASEDGSIQIEDIHFTNIYYNLNLGDNLFDIPLPETYSHETEKTLESDIKQLAVGSPAPNFTLADDKDTEHRLADYRGRIVLLDFWGTWCKWCVKSMPELQKIHEHYKNDNVTLLGISCSEPHGANPRMFMDDNNYNYQLLVQGDEVAKKYLVNGYPTLFVIGRDGIILDIIIGYYPDLYDRLKSIIEKEK